MKVQCTANLGDALPDKYFAQGYTRSSSFESDLRIGKEYVIYGICLYSGTILYLLRGEGPYPHWYPAELFVVTDGQIPRIWQYAFFGLESQLNAVWGYDELVNDSDYFDRLADLEESAVLTFEKLRSQVENLTT